MKQHLIGNITGGSSGSSYSAATPDSMRVTACSALQIACMADLFDKVGPSNISRAARFLACANVHAERHDALVKAMWKCWEVGRCAGQMGTTKDTRGDWCSERGLTAGWASVCQPEPTKRLDHASMSEHRCSFDHTLYCVSHRMQAQYHTTRASCQDVVYDFP